jgi:hypothetical protein
MKIGLVEAVRHRMLAKGAKGRKLAKEFLDKAIFHVS